jgi:hypothetical protein
VIPVLSDFCWHILNIEFITKELQDQLIVCDTVQKFDIELKSVKHIENFTDKPGNLAS